MSIARKILMGSSGGKKSTYVDDVFSTYLWKGDNTHNRHIQLGFDYENEEGLIWIKNRQGGDYHVLFDTLRGVNKRITSNATDAETTTSGEVKQFTSTGYRIGATGTVNGNDKFSSWNFMSSPGFFDVVTYTGTGVQRTINHDLGSIPGMIMIKRTDASASWIVYHRGLETDSYPAWTYAFQGLSTADAKVNYNWLFKSAPTAASFEIGTGALVNTNGGSYVAYIFAGGESTADTARSVYFGGNEYLSIADHSDFTFGTDDFTLECWYKADNLSLSNSWDYIFAAGWPVQLAHTIDGGTSTSRFTFYMKDTAGSGGSYFVTNLNTGNGSVHADQWYHVAVTRSGSIFRIFLNGVLKGTATSSTSAPAPGVNTDIGRFGPSNSYYATGKISNLRLVKGTALYTESFRPSTEPLTAITNTKLLCCNNSSVTGSTVTPGTITNFGLAAMTQSPFDDPEGFKFGEEGDQNIIKTGSYTGNGSSTVGAGPEIYLGWEPQYVMIKNSSSGSWMCLDSMRGIVTDDTSNSDRFFTVNTLDAEAGAKRIDLTPTGFKISGTSNANYNANGNTFTYIAVRRPDGYVGKPAEAGTDVFAMDTGAGSSTIPNFDSGFPVDLSLIRNPTSSASWWAGTRLTSGKEIKVNGIDVPVTWQYGVYDSNVGWQNYSGHGSSEMSWMWKRHAGFDVVTYRGNGATSQTLGHSLGRTPEMMWIRGRGPSVANWYVYHKDLDNPNRRFLKLENIDGQSGESTGNLNDTAPTATTFTVGVNPNGNGENYLTMLFASVDGISKVGSYTGNASASGPTINLGFAPRFILIKCKTASTNWLVYDTLRGLTSGDDKRLYLNTNAGQDTADDIDPSATGFQVVSTWDQLNDNNAKYVYYAHA